MRKSLEENKILFVGGARGGGKSWFVRAIALEYAYRYPGINIAIFRTHYPELEANHIDPMMTEYPHLRKFFKLGRKVVEIPVHDRISRIRFCHCSSEQDLKRYQGSEYQFLIIDEAGEWTRTLITKLRASNRSSDPNIPVKLLLTGNPGGAGHDYLKRLFVERKFIPPEKASDYAFVPAFLDDNPALTEADPDYRSILEQEPNEATRRAWLHGDWDVFAGQFYPEFRQDIHVIEDVDVEKDLKDWKKFIALDWGYYHPAAVIWFAQHPSDGSVIAYREYLTRQESPDELRKNILKFDDTRQAKWVCAGKDIWNKARDGGPSIEQTMRSGNKEDRLFLIKANDDRIQGWSQVRAYLAWNEDTEGVRSVPRFRITKSCRFLIEGIPRLQHHKTKPEEVMLMPYKEGMRLGDSDDMLDCLRYGLMGLPPANKVVAAKKRRRTKWDALLQGSGRASSWQTT